MLGVIFAVLSSVFFGLYVIPRKLSKLPAIQFSTLIALGFSCSSILLYVVQIMLKNNEGLGDPALVYAVLAGVLWATALVMLVTAIDVIGVARSNQWKNLQGPVGVLLALVVLNEASSVNPVLAGLSGVAIFTSAVLFNIRAKGDDRKLNQSGVLLALGSGVLFGVVSLINKYVTTNAGVYSQQVIWSVSILLSLVVFQAVTGRFSIKAFTKSTHDSLLGISSGLLYLGASAFMLLAFKHMEASIAFTIIQMNFLVVILLGIFVFKEFKFKGNELRILTGLCLAAIGVVLLAFAR